jgi:hypothetical protein
MRRALLPLLLATLLLAPGCRRSRLSPEEQVRKAIDVAVQAVRERDIKPLTRAVSDSYSDREQNDKQKILSLVRMHFVLHPNLYLLSKISSVDCPSPTEARVIVFAAMASVPPGVVPDPLKIAADVLRFELAMVDEDGTWRVASASWAPASVKELL